jgi:hypothetical protein
VTTHAKSAHATVKNRIGAIKLRIAIVLTVIGCADGIVFAK